MHRNSQKRVYGDYVYFITCDVHNQIEYFKEEILCEFWMEELKLAKKLENFRLFAFCLNYDHFHLLMKPNNNVANYSKIMQFIKRNFSQNINKILGYTKFKPDNSIEGQFESGITIDIEGDFAQSRLRNNTESQKTESDDTHRRLREFDQITKKFREKYINKFGTHFHHPKFKWQKSFYDHIIRNQNDYEKHWNYTMNNFSKHNLPENWKYTGLNFPELIDDINDDKMI